MLLGRHDSCGFVCFVISWLVAVLKLFVVLRFYVLPVWWWIWWICFLLHVFLSSPLSALCPPSFFVRVSLPLVVVRSSCLKFQVSRQSKNLFWFNKHFWTSLPVLDSSLLQFYPWMNLIYQRQNNWCYILKGFDHTSYSVNWKFAHNHNFIFRRNESINK